MADTIHEIFRNIKEKLTADHLKKITVDIINSYKCRDYRHLNRYFSVLKIKAEKNARSFSCLIKQYHPDKLTSILRQAEEIYRSNNTAELQKFYDKYFFNISPERHITETDVEFKTEYRFGRHDFGYSERYVYEEDYHGESDPESAEDNGSFIHAINKLLFGGLDFNINPSDLEKLDGLLDLSDYDISDLKGIEHCMYVEEMNLSGNNIERIGRLSGLKYLQALFISANLIENIEPLENLIDLKELDISFNNISDIAVLENLKKLEYVNIIGNPVKDYTVINNLVKKGVIVVFEHTHILF